MNTTSGKSTVFRHYGKGDKYVLLGHTIGANNDSTQEVNVIYRRMKDGAQFNRRASEFYSDVTVEGKTVPRFECLGYCTEEDDGVLRCDTLEQTKQTLENLGQR